MTNKVSKEFLQEHFRKHDSITLYKPDGTPVTISKQYSIMLRGGHAETSSSPMMNLWISTRSVILA